MGGLGPPNQWGQDTVGLNYDFEWVAGWFRADSSLFDYDEDGIPDVDDEDPVEDLVYLLTYGLNGVAGDGDEPMPPPGFSGQCGWSYVQHMAIDCPGGWVEYESHPLSTTIFPSEIGVSRDSETPPNLVWP